MCTNEEKQANKSTDVDEMRKESHRKSFKRQRNGKRVAVSSIV